MKNIKYFLIFLALVIVAVIAVTYTNSKPRKAKENPYEYNVDQYKEVDPALIHYKEVREIKVALGEHGAISTFDGNIYLAANAELMVITPEGNKLIAFPIEPDARAVAVENERIAIAHKQYIEVVSYAGELLYKTDIVSDSSVYTSVAFHNDKVFVADAGKRRIYGFKDEKLITEIEGISGTSNLHGFIVPSPYFEIAVNSENQLWCTNPGLHALQQYSENGDLLNAWDKASLEIEGFNGCCNPAQFTFLHDGRFVTSEKGMPRIKVYSKAGVLESVVAAPNKFEGNQHAAEVACIGETIVALDFDREMIRIFEPK